ncbi:MAG: DUF2130 domain-containing protein [Candidatus Dadabacteria bacterium]|nr:DUF2130 domain-containing protein [Candidatus Dadabacteria bacterium]
MKNSNKIECPQCGNEIDVSEVLSHQLNEKIRRELTDKNAKELSKIKKEIESDTRKRVRLEQEGKIESLEKELDEKSKQVQKLNKAEARIERLMREKNEMQSELELKAERDYNEKLSQEKGKIKKNVESKFELKISDQQKLINDLNKQINELQRKGEQGSQQLQGEVQEVAIESWLKEKFPADSIKEVKKGQTGADCLQTVRNNLGQDCGTIYYESKRTKTFQKSWLSKFKSDMQNKKATIGVIVTETMPSDMERLGQKDGIWICSFDEFKGLCSVLRESIIQISTVAVSQKNKGSKMEMLYGFLTSSEFRLQVESIVEGFSTLKTNLDSEKRAMNRVWKEREKQIEKVISSTTNMYASIRGIAGNAVQSVQSLELPSGEEGSE